MSAPPLYLVACVAQKLDRPALARDLYTSPWFRKARTYVEARGAEWRILSALWGLVDPDELLEPYERTMRDHCAAGRRSWAARVCAQLADVAPAPRPIVMLAGESYRRPLRDKLAQPVAVPMRGLGIGEQLAYLTKHQRPTSEQ